MENRLSRIPQPMRRNGLGVRVALCALLVGAAAFCRQNSPETAQVMRSLFLGPSDGPAAQAFASLTDALEKEESVPDAIAVFCETFRTSLQG